MYVHALNKNREKQHPVQHEKKEIFPHTSRESKSDLSFKYSFFLPISRTLFDHGRIHKFSMIRNKVLERTHQARTNGLSIRS